MSNTSLLICASQCWPGSPANSLSQQLAKQVLQRSGWRGRVLLALQGWRGGRALLTGLLQFSLPGIMAHYGWRKQHIVSWIEQQIEQQNTQQLVIVGAGFDGLGAMLSAKYRQLQVVEIDRVATINIKQDVLRQLHALRPNLCLKAADLGRCSLAQLLADTAEFSAERPTLMLAEGVLMYLPETAINNLLQQMRQSVNAPLQLVASQMQLDQHGKPRFSQQGWLADMALAISGERFVSGITPQALPGWLVNLGFNLQQLVPAEQPENNDPCPGELLFYATAKSVP